MSNFKQSWKLVYGKDILLRSGFTLYLKCKSGTVNMLSQEIASCQSE